MVHNEQHFAPLAGAVLQWELATDGIPFADGETELLPIDPCTAREALLTSDPHPAGEIILTVQLLTGSSTDLVPARHVIAWEQWVLTGRFDAMRITAGGSTAHPFALELAPEGPRLVSGDTVLRGPTPALWRAPTDNDYIRGISGQEEKPGMLWYRMGLDQLVSTWTIHRDGDDTVLDGEHRAGPAGPVRARSRFVLTAGGGGGGTARAGGEARGNGSGAMQVQVLRVEIDVDREITDLPRVGVRLDLPGRYDQMEWYGRGPQENYPDRSSGYPLGLWRSAVLDQYVPYIVPQEHGGHGATRCVRLLTGAERRAGSVLLAAPEGKSFHFSALPFAPEDLDSLTHTWQVEPREETILIVDRFHRGLGTGACGPDCAPRYRSGGGHFVWELYLSAFG
jgi:beta-galactosidase